MSKNCFQCDTPFSYTEDGLVCENCGVVMYGYVWDFPADFKTHVVHPSYKRTNHFKKILSHYPQISRSEASTLTSQFSQLQQPFERNKCRRRNMLPYRFILYKLCDGPELKHLQSIFKISKSKSKLQEQTDLWNKMLAV